MIWQLLRRTLIYKIMIGFFLLSTVLLLFLALHRVSYIALCLLFLEEIVFFVLMVLSGMIQAKAVMEEEWFDPFERQLDPQRVKTAFLQDPVLADTPDGTNLMGICEIVLGHPEESVALFQKALAKRPNKLNQTVLYCNCAIACLQLDQLDHAQSFLSQAKESWAAVPIKQRQKYQHKIPFESIQMQIAYQRKTIDPTAYIQYLEDMLWKETMTLRKRMEIRYRLAILYHQQKDDFHAFEQLRWLDRFAAKTFYAKRVHALLEEGVDAQ